MPRRTDVKPAGKPAGARVKRTVSLSAEASRRLDVHALGLGIRPGAALERLITEHCRGFVLSDHRRGNHAEAQPPPAGQGGSEAA